MIKLKRIYDDFSFDDGYRILVDRLWPRGVSKERAHLDLWLKEIAPSDELRKWFGHRPKRWGHFQRRYRGELRRYPETKAALKALIKLVRENDVTTLLYAAEDTEMNNAVALKAVLDKKV